MIKRLFVFSMVMVLVAFGADNMPYGQARLERWLANIIIPDYFPNGEPPYVPLRYRDALTEFREFFENSGWTTNQFIEGLIFAATNNMSDANWADETKRLVSERAIWKLSEIDNPVVTNFFRVLNDDGNVHFKSTAISAMLYHTNLEPDILSYMRTLCVRTNIYANLSSSVIDVMHETLDTMPPELKPAATNRVAKYMYYSLFHVPRHIIWEDRRLAEFIPAYSNSSQRLDAMRYVQSTTTNLRTRVLAQLEVDRLSAIPTNQLNDISWITEDL